MGDRNDRKFFSSDLMEIQTVPECRGWNLDFTAHEEQEGRMSSTLSCL